MALQSSEILVWVLVHSLWQGVLIAGGVALLLRSTPARRAETRYAASVGGLGLIVLCALVTWSILGLDPDKVTADSTIATASITITDPGPSISISRTEQAATASGQPLIDHPAPAARPNASWRNWTAWVAAVWMIGAGLMLIRTLSAIVEVRHWRLSRTDIPQTGLEHLQALHAELCQRLHLRRVVTLILSDRVNVPAVIGTLWPCILIPPAMLTGIPLDHWRVILAHELAHIRRHDALVNLVQMVIESLFFFNPAVWWLSRQIRIEREACCDALAAEVCGQPLSVARALVEFAAELNGDARWPATRTAEQTDEPATTRSSAVMAFADPQEPGELTDRVQRLVQPEVAVRPRMSWVGLLVVIGLLLVAVEVLHWGTTIAVQTAAQLMTPKERVAKLERLQTETSGVFLPPEPPPRDSNKPAQSEDSKSDTPTAEKCQVTIIVRTADGSPLPKMLQTNYFSVRGNSSASGTLDNLTKEEAEYHKVHPFDPCQLRIGAFAPGFAPVVSDVMNVLPGDKERSVELVIGRGHTVTMQVRGPQDQPIPMAELRVMPVLTYKGGSSSLGMTELVADEQGQVSVPNVGNVTYDVTVKAPGFQRQDFRLDLKGKEIQQLAMRPAVPVDLTVVDKSTGRPVSDARVVAFILNRASGSHKLGDPRRSDSKNKWVNYGTTDANGKATLSELQDGTRYTFGVVVEGYAVSVLKGVHVGQAPLSVEMIPPLTLAGRIEGDLSRIPLASRNGQGKPLRTLSFTQQFDPSYMESVNFNVDDDGRFEINNLTPNEKITIHLFGKYHEYLMTKSITDLVLKIDDAPATPAVANRHVVIKLTGTAPDAPARGTLYVSWQAVPGAGKGSEMGEHPLRRNEIHLDLAVGTKLYFRPNSLVGYQIDEQSNIGITAGTTPQVIEVPTRPAGGIYVTITRADGSEATGAFITVFASKLPPGEKNHGRINPSIASASSRALASLPFGGKYRVLAREIDDKHSAWVLSEEIAVDEAHPITEIKLQLPRGRTIPVKVLGPNGAPLANQLVGLNLGFSQTSGHSNSVQAKRITNQDGVAVFEDFAIDAPIEPLKLTLHGEIESEEFIGWTGEINSKQPIVIQLEKGVAANGVVVEASSGKPIPSAEVRVMPRNFSAAKFRGAKKIVTDAKGEFHFEGLEPIEYTAYVEGTVPKGTIITRLSDGGLQFEYPSGVEQHHLDPLSKTPTRLEVQIHPNSRLKVVE